jgi:hypothetical protein
MLIQPIIPHSQSGLRVRPPTGLGSSKASGPSGKGFVDQGKAGRQGLGPPAVGPVTDGVMQDKGPRSRGPFSAKQSRVSKFVGYFPRWLTKLRKWKAIEADGGEGGFEPTVRITAQRF